MQNEQCLSFSNGDSSCIEQLINQHEDNLYTLCLKLALNRLDAEDLYQQTWLKAIQKAHTFSQKSFKNWLYTICINLYRDDYRAKMRKKVINSHLGEDANEYVMKNATDHVSAEKAAMDNLQRTVLVSKINRLPNKQRIPLILFYFEGLEYKEIAAMLSVPIGTIKSRLNIAKRNLRSEMENELNV